MSQARRIGPQAVQPMVIGGDVEDDVDEGPTVLVTNLDDLGIERLRLVQPRWEQPEGVSDAETAPTGPSPVLMPPRDPARTFPEPEDVADDADMAPVDPPPEAASIPSRAALTRTPAEAPREGPDPYLIVLTVGGIVAVAGVIALGGAILWLAS